MTTRWCHFCSGAKPGRLRYVLLNLCRWMVMVTERRACSHRAGNFAALKPAFSGRSHPQPRHESGTGISGRWPSGGDYFHHQPCLCGQCDRLRLSAQGELYNCLFAEQPVPLKALIEQLQTHMAPAAREQLLQQLQSYIWQKNPAFMLFILKPQPLPGAPGKSACI